MPRRSSIFQSRSDERSIIYSLVVHRTLVGVQVASQHAAATQTKEKYLFAIDSGKNFAQFLAVAVVWLMGVSQRRDERMATARRISHGL